MRNRPLLAAFPIALAIACATAFALAGCGGDAAPSDAATAAQSAQPAGDSPSPAAAAPPPREFQPVRLGGASDSATSPAKQPVPADPAARAELVRRKLQPLQVLVGTWEGKTFRRVQNFSAVDEPRWKWDLSQKGQPALLMESPKNQYVTRSRLTYLPDGEKYRLETVHKDGGGRTFEGTFTAPVRDEAVEGEEAPQRKFELEFVEVNAGDAKDVWQVTFDQQGNNRYHLKLFKQRPSTQKFDVPIDTLAMQRQGTSFAQSDSDYGDRTCVISEGLGTIQLSYAGKTYWVCCTGCQAAFEEDPEMWIAKAEERAQAK
ncbi:MAG: hypothetical protein WD069_17035 [Planctomycetales bacterium]